MKQVINELREFLVQRGLVCTPSEPTARPMAWLAPAGGVPAPGEGTPPSDVVVGLYPAPGTALGPFEQRWLARDAVDVYIRSGAYNQPDALDLAFHIRLELADRSAFDMGELRVQQCLERSPVRLVSSDEGQGATYVITFEFLFRVESFHEHMNARSSVLISPELSVEATRGRYADGLIASAAEVSAVPTEIHVIPARGRAAGGATVKAVPREINFGGSVSGGGTLPGSGGTIPGGSGNTPGGGRP